MNQRTYKKAHTYIASSYYAFKLLKFCTWELWMDSCVLIIFIKNPHSSTAQNVGRRNFCGFACSWPIHQSFCLLPFCCILISFWQASSLASVQLWNFYITKVIMLDLRNRCSDEHLTTVFSFILYYVLSFHLQIAYRKVRNMLIRL